MIRNVLMGTLLPGTDARHNELRAGLAPLAAEVARVQFEVP